MLRGSRLRTLFSLLVSGVLLFFLYRTYFDGRYPARSALGASGLALGARIEVECIAEEVLPAVNEKTSIVTFSLGSDNAGDAVFLFMADICGEASEEDSPPKHAHAFGNLGRLHKQMYEERVTALKAFHGVVTARNFPYPEQSFTMHPDDEEKFLEALDKE